MNDRDRSFERLRRANPAPTSTVEGKPTGREMLAKVQETAPRHEPHKEPGLPARRGLLVAAAAFALILLITIPVLLFVNSSEQEPPVVTEPAPPPTTIPPTPLPQTPLPQTSAPPPDELDTATEQLLDFFVAAHNAGDVDAFMALLHPDLDRVIRADRDERRSSLDTVQIHYAVDAALNAEITLDCSPGQDLVVCEVQRIDDLHRILGAAPTGERTWFFQFDNGLVRVWNEQRFLLHDVYEIDIVTQFTDWVATNHPEVGSLYAFNNWVAKPGIGDTIAPLVDDWAASLGVSLQE